MSALSITNTFIPGTIISSSQMNQNFSDISSWANGNIDNTNLTTLTGTVTWSVTTNSLAIAITNTGTQGSISIIHNGTLAAAKAALLISSSTAQAAGDALLEIRSTSASSAIPAVLINDAGVGGSALKVVSTTKPSHPLPSMTTAQRDSLTSLTAGDVIYNTDTQRPEYYNGTSWLPKAPIQQIFTSGTATYTPTASNILYLKVRMVGGGGGGGGTGGGGASAGGTGGNTTLGSAILTANGGIGGGANAAAGGAGGSATIAGSGVSGTAVAGGTGTAGNNNSSASLVVAGGVGASSPFGGAGGGSAQGADGFDAVVNSGSGGGGGGAASSAANSGSGGGAGGFIEALVSGATLAAWIATPPTYVIGAGGTRGTAGGGADRGGQGGSGYIEITEYY